MIRTWLPVSRSCAALALALGLLGCSTLDNAPLNQPTSIPPLVQAQTIAGDDVLSSTLVGLSFSGGGMRAAAFSYGVLKGLDATALSGSGRLVDQVRFVSGVSGGSVTAAYFGLAGRRIFQDYEQRFLYKDAEAGLRTALWDPTNLARAASSGVNDRSNLPKWLDENLFGGATLSAFNAPGRPTVWINASDVNAKAPFVFEPLTFAAICSDLSRFPISEAVAASAAVPVIFAPIVVQSFADRCGFRVPLHLQAAASGPEASANVKAYVRALEAYRDPKAVKFIKLLDGGLTDNWGLQAVNVAVAAGEFPWKPLAKEDAIALKEFIFIVVDAGRSDNADWSRTLEGPTGGDLLMAATDTAIGSAVRSSFEVFRLQMRAWKERLADWRCALPMAEIEAVRGSLEGWKCRDVNVRVVTVSFDDLDPATAATLGKVPTRFKLDPAQVRAVIAAGETAVRKVLGRGM